MADSRATGRELLDYLGTYFQQRVHSRPALLLNHSFSPRGYPFRTKPRSRHSIPPPASPPADEPWVEGYAGPECWHRGCPAPLREGRVLTAQSGPHLRHASKSLFLHHCSLPGLVQQGAGVRPEDGLTRTADSLRHHGVWIADVEGAISLLEGGARCG